MKIYVTRTFYLPYGEEARTEMHIFDDKMRADGFQRIWANIEQDNQFVVYAKDLK